MTGGIRMGKLRPFSAQRLKIKLSYKKNLQILSEQEDFSIWRRKKYNNNNDLKMFSGMVFAKYLDA